MHEEAAAKIGVAVFQGPPLPSSDGDIPPSALFSVAGNRGLQETTRARLLFIMTENAGSERTLIDRAMDWLTGVLPSSITVERSKRQVAGADDRVHLEALIEIRGNNGTTATIAVEAKRRVSPREAEALLSGVAGAIAHIGGVKLLVVAEWLSPRTREILVARGIDYLDLTGNALINLEYPTVFLRTAGSARDPLPVPQGQARLRGPKAGRLVRMLADVAPPYGVRELAAIAELAPGYVSRLLDTLDREGIVDRGPRGQVLAVDLSALLRRYCQSYDLFSANHARSFVAQRGTAAVLRALRELEGPVITGSYAAVRVAPVAAPALLAIYCTAPSELATPLGLLPTDSGTDVVLLQPADPVVWQGTTTEDGLIYAAPTQVAMDCLSGNGRMPAEGEALLEWLTKNEPRWQRPSLAAAASETRP